MSSDNNQQPVRTTKYCDRSTRQLSFKLWSGPMEIIMVMLLGELNFHFLIAKP